MKLLRPGDLKNLPKLQLFTLAYNELEEIPEGVFNNTKLIYLNLNQNKITQIASKAFDDMSALIELHIGSNNLTQWDNNWLSGAKSVVEISVSYNVITQIPDEAFKNYPRVESISFHGNEIKKISVKAFDKLERVDYLDLSDNEIDEWNPDLLVNVSVGSLDLSGNKLNCIDGDLKTIFTNVESINFWENPWNETCAKKIDEYITNWQTVQK